MTVANPSKVVLDFMEDYKTENINPNSYDLRVERVFEVRGGITIYANGDRELPKYASVKTYKDHEDRELFKLVPGKLYQVETIESVSLPLRYCAVSLMRSSMHKSGASGEVGLYDSGYRGKCGMSVSVSSDCIIEKGASMFQLVFFEADALAPYRGRYLDNRWIERLIES